MLLLAQVDLDRHWVARRDICRNLIKKFLHLPFSLLGDLSWGISIMRERYLHDPRDLEGLTSLPR